MNNISINYIFSFLKKGSQRTRKTKLNIIYIFLIKGISIAIGLAYVPLILDYLDPERYGVWLTLSSMITWLGFLDIGLGHGFRNRFAEALALDNKKLAAEYVSTIYAILSIISVSFIFSSFLFYRFLNWQKILNSSLVPINELSLLALITFISFMIRLVLQLIGNILLADQRPAVNSSFMPASNIISLILILIIKKTTQGSLLLLGIILNISPIVVYLLANIYFFLKDYRQYYPSLKNINLSLIKNLINLGIKFFIIQIAVVIFYTSSNFIIIHVTDPEEVTKYNIAYKYFSVPFMIFTMALTPFWSVYTEAFVKRDFSWIKKSIRYLNAFSILLILLIVVIFIFSQNVFDFWIGDRVRIPNILSLFMVIFFATKIVGGPYSQFLNGSGRLKLGIYLIIIKVIFFIPLAIYLGKSQLGAAGVVLAICLCNLISLIFEPIQTYKLLNNNAHGIWNE